MRLGGETENWLTAINKMEEGAITTVEASFAKHMTTKETVQALSSHGD